MHRTPTVSDSRTARGRWTGQPGRISWLEAARAGLVVLGLAHALWHIGYTIDDAAISYAYARNLATGLGFVFQAGDPPVEGVTNLLWVLVLAGGIRTGIDPMVLSKALGLLALAATIWLTATFPLGNGRSEPTDRRPAGEIPRLAAAALVALAAPIAIWSVAGLETAAFGGLLLAGCAALVRSASPGAGRRSGAWVIAAFALLLAATLTRPEGGLFLGVAAGLGVAWRIGGRSVPVGGLLAGLLISGGGLLLLTLWRLWIFAYPLPNTFYAKAGERSVAAFPSYLGNLGDPGWAYLARFGAEFAVLPAVVIVLAALPLFRSPGRQAVIAFLAAGLVAVIYEGGDDMIAYRFLAPFIPFGALALAGAVTALTRPRRRWPLLLLGPVAVLWIVPNLRLTFAERIDPLATFAEVATTASRLEDDLAGAGIVAPIILTPDIGGFAYPDGPRIIDLGRLVDSTLAHHGYLRPVFSNYVFEQRRPTLLRTHHHWTTDSRILDEPAFLRDYLPLRQWTDGGATGGEYLRQDALFGPAPATAQAAPGSGPLPGLNLTAWENVTLAGETDRLRLWLYWTRTGDVVGNPALSVRLTSSAGSIIATVDHRPTNGLLSADRWPGGSTARDYVELTLPPGLPVGDHVLEVAAAGQPGHLTLGALRPGAGAPAAQGDLDAALDRGDTEGALAAFRRLAAGRLVADPVLLPLLDRVRVQAAERVRATADPAIATHLAAILWPFTGWGALPPTVIAAAGDCATRGARARAAGNDREALAWLICATDLAPGDAARRRALEDLRTRVQAVRLPALPAATTPVEATFGRRIRLLGYDLSGPGVASTAATATPDRGSLVAGQAITLTLYFEATAPMTTDYEVFVHLDRADGRTGADHFPPLATSRWPTGEVVRDAVTLRVPTEASGAAAMWIGVWDRRESLPVTAGQTENDGARVRLGTFTIQPVP